MGCVNCPNPNSKNSTSPAAVGTTDLNYEKTKSSNQLFKTPDKANSSHYLGGELFSSEIKKKIGFDDPLMYAVLKQVFDKLHDSPFWVITPEFIMSLGETYLSLLAGKAMRAFLTSADNG